MTRSKGRFRIKGAPFYGSSSHLIMLITKFHGREVGFEDIKEMNPIKYKYLSDMRRELLRLEIAGFIIFAENDPNRWSITNKGISYIYETAKKNARKVIDDKDGN